MPAGALRHLLADWLGNVAPDDHATCPMVPRRVMQPHSSTAFTSSASATQTFMLVSGVSAEKEMCIVVEGGQTSTSGASLAMQPCEKAVRFGDGRELFSFQGNGQLVTASGGMCVGASATQEQGALKLMTCDGEAEEGMAVDANQISWQLTPQNQLQALSLGGDGRTADQGMCLSLGGTGAPGDEDVAPGGTAHASSQADGEAHSATRAIDGRSGTYWASELDPDKPVELQLDLNEAKSLSSVDIKWECPPPERFRVETAGGRINGGWTQVFSHEPAVPPSTTFKMRPPKNDATNGSETNPVTHVVLDGAKGSAVRVVLDVPAPQCDTANGRRMFGIRKLAVKAKRRFPVLEECPTAAKSADANDKWFLTRVGQWQPAKRLKEYEYQFL